MKRVGICPIPTFFRNGTSVTQPKKPKNDEPKIIPTWNEIQELEQKFLGLVKRGKPREHWLLNILYNNVDEKLKQMRDKNEGRKVPKRKIGRMKKLLIEIDTSLFL